MKQRLALFSLAALVSSLAAQSNVVPGLDGKLEILDDITYWGRRGAAYPGGEIGLSMRNTMCNPGSVSIPWYAQMQENHPKFGFLITRLRNDRMEQISDRSYCKHAFTSASTSGGCGPCNGIGGNQMGVTCSDTYTAGNNGSRFNLGPPDEIDPWLGTWNHLGSFFDQGLPNVGSPANNDGNQSPINVGDEVQNRVTVKESDLGIAGAQYFYGIQLIHQGEAVANRWDNLKSRGMTATWNGSGWTVGNSTVGEDFGSILRHWPGADLNSASNGNDDGRFFVASKVTPLGGGQFHYEYAVHNVDNHRGGATLRIPIDAGATASNFTFRDIDGDALNDWTAARAGNEIVFTAPASNPLNWNTIFNFGFDANFAPGQSFVALDEARVGPGALQVLVGAKAPSGASFAQATPVGQGCGGIDCAASFYQLFAPGSTCDLANTKWQLSWNGTNYTVGTGTATYVTPAGTALTMGDDVEVNVALPFALPYPGGATTSLKVCSNGFVSAANNGVNWTPTSTEFLSGAPRWAGLWYDLLPTTGQVRVDSTPSVVRISFTNVPHYGQQGTTCTFQYQFFANGDVAVIYQALNGMVPNALVGFTPGGNAQDPGNSDVSATIPAGFSLCAGSTPDVTLTSQQRPVLGSTIDLVTANIPAGTVAGLIVLSATQVTPGADLTFLGMPGCELYLGLDALGTFPVSGSTASVPWTVPSSASLSGAVAMAQTATLTPGINAFGLATSNGVQLLLGQN